MSERIFVVVQNGDLGKLLVLCATCGLEVRIEEELHLKKAWFRLTRKQAMKLLPALLKESQPGTEIKLVFLGNSH